MTSIFAEATRKAASARFKQPQLDAEGQEIEVSLIYVLCESMMSCDSVGVSNSRWT